MVPPLRTLVDDRTLECRVAMKVQYPSRDAVRTIVSP